MSLPFIVSRAPDLQVDVLQRSWSPNQLGRKLTEEEEVGSEGSGVGLDLISDGSWGGGVEIDKFIF